MDAGRLTPHLAAFASCAALAARPTAAVRPRARAGGPSPSPACCARCAHTLRLVRAGAARRSARARSSCVAPRPRLIVPHLCCVSPVHTPGCHRNLWSNKCHSRDACVWAVGRWARNTHDGRSGWTPALVRLSSRCLIDPDWCKRWRRCVECTIQCSYWCLHREQCPHPTRFVRAPIRSVGNLPGLRAPLARRRCPPCG